MTFSFKDDKVLLMNIRDKDGSGDLNGFQLVWLFILIGLFYWLMWTEGVQYAVDNGYSKEPSQWYGFGSCWIFTSVIYGFIKICKKIGGW